MNANDMNEQGTHTPGTQTPGRTENRIQLPRLIRSREVLRSHLRHVLANHLHLTTRPATGNILF